MTLGRTLVPVRWLHLDSGDLSDLFSDAHSILVSPNLFVVEDIEHNPVLHGYLVTGGR